MNRVFIRGTEVVTKEYIDNTITNIGKDDQNYVIYPNYKDNDAVENRIAFFQKVITDMKNGKTPIIYTEYNNAKSGSVYGGSIYTAPAISENLENFSGNIYFKSDANYRSCLGTDAGKPAILVAKYTKTITVTLTNGEVTNVNTPEEYSNKVGDVVSGILTMSNVTEYTPTGDYHPATKKYVDNKVANIDIPEIDLSNYFTKEEMKTTYLGLPIFEIPFELSEIQDWIIGNLIPYATENGWDSFYLKFTGLSGDQDQNYFKGLYFLESFHDISEEESRDYKIYYFKNISGYVHRIVDGAEYTDFATMYPAIALYLYADNSVRGFETASVSDIGTNSATALRTDIDYRTPYMPLYNGSPATKLYVDNKVAAIRTPQSHDGEGMIG